MKQAGQRLGITYLVEGQIPVDDEAFVSYLCSIGVKATDAQGIFRGVAGDVDVMILVHSCRFDP